jgi:F0F1-type ATP synthase gamma subunit
MRFFYLYFLFFVSLTLLSCKHSAITSSNNKFERKLLHSDYFVLKNILELKHPSLYWYTSKDSMDYYFEYYKNKIQDSMTEQEFTWQVLAPLINKIHCGHTSVMRSKENIKLNKNKKNPSFPLELKFWNDTMAVVGNLNSKDSIFKRGVIIKSINGISAKEIISQMLDHLSEDGYAHNVNYIRISSNFPALHNYVFGLSKEYTISYEDTTGNILTAVLPLYVPEKDTIKMKEKKDSVLITKKTAAPKIKKITKYRSLQIDSSRQFAVMRLNSFSNGRLRSFFRKSFRTIRKNHLPNLIVDIRTNGGGNVSTSTLFTKYFSEKKFKVADSVFSKTNNVKPYSKYFKEKWLNNLGFAFVAKKKSDGKYHLTRYERKYFKPKEKNHFAGHAYVLINGPTFSASCLFVNAIKGQQHITVVGEESGGGWYGNNGIFIPEVKLPSTHIRVNMPLFRVVQYQHENENKGKGIWPDLYIPTNFDALKKGYDMKMKVVKDMIMDAAKQPKL